MRRIICILLSVCMLFCLTACGGDQDVDPGTTDPVTQPEGNEPQKDPATQTTDPTLPTAEPEDPSLVAFRQAMVETPQRFAAAFFGDVPQGADPLAVMREAAPQLCEDLPFLLTIDQEHTLGTEGQLFCIVPADETAAVAVNRVKWNVQNESYECTDVLYRSESSDPFLLLCNSGEQEPDTEIVITGADGETVFWYPYLEISHTLATLYNSSAESLLFDFTPYEELPAPEQEPGIDSPALLGTWDLAWTEVEGDRNEAEPGVCTIEITQDEAGRFRFTYTSRDYLEGNRRDRELLVVPGELYPGCGNDQWIAEVAEEADDAEQYTLTLLEDGTLLLQTYWEMDGMPCVSYGWYQKIN